MMKITLKVLNWLSYILGCSALGSFAAKFYWGLFKFLTDEKYAKEHPKMYLLKFFGVLALWIVLALGLIWYPLTKVMEWIDEKIEKNFKKDADEDKDDFEDDYDFLK